MSIRPDLNDSCLLMLYRVNKEESPDEESPSVEVLLGRKVIFNGITDDPTADKVELSGSANQRMGRFAEGLKAGGDFKPLMKRCGIMYPGAGTFTYPGGRIKQTVKGAKQIHEILAGYKGLAVSDRKSKVAVHDETTGKFELGEMEGKDLALVKVAALKEFYEEFLLTSLSHSLEDSQGENLLNDLLTKIQLVFINTFGTRKGFFFALSETDFLAAHKKERLFLESIMGIIEIGCLLDMSFNHYLNVVNNIMVRAYQRNVKALAASTELSSQGGSIELFQFAYATAEQLEAYYSEPCLKNEDYKDELRELFKGVDKVLARTSPNSPEMRKKIWEEMQQTIERNHTEAKAYIPLAAGFLTNKVHNTLRKAAEEAKQ